MNVEELREYCLSLAKAEENAPWTEPEDQMLVTFTVGGKWFCFADIEKKFINVKCSPEQTEEMQEIISLRLIAEAKRRLAATDHDISIIAYDLGFQYPQHFTRLFKRVTGKSPSAFRNEFHCNN